MSIAITKPKLVADHRFYGAVSLILALVVFAGFSRTYYLKGLFGASSLPLLVHMHGAVMTLWYALFIMQVRLVASNRVALHRRLGIAGVFLAGGVAVLATMVAIGLAHRRLMANPDSKEGPFLLGLQLFAIVLVFVVLITAAVYLRRRTDYHKRLMTLAMLTVLGPAVVRLPVIEGKVLVVISINISLILVCVIVDTIRNRRLHPAFGWGGALVIGSIFLVFPFAESSLWAHFVQRMLL
ncbi:MAG: hypothetical protein HY010_10235 [Acidobacteria bacterium]|nr:hypothetical protein [Acidobacteriota bacterium]